MSHGHCHRGMSHVLEVGVSRPINDKRQLEETSQVQQDGIPLPDDSKDKTWDGGTGSTFRRQHFRGQDHQDPQISSWDDSETRIMHVSHMTPWVEVR